MKKNYDICTAKPEKGLNVVAQVPSGRKKQTINNPFYKMTKAEIVSEISRTTGLEKGAVLDIVEKFMEVVKDTMSGGENIYLRGFGSFVVKTRKEKTARNISKNTAIKIPEHKIPSFKPSRVFLDEVK